MKNGACLSTKQHDVIQPFITANKKRKLKAKIKMIQEQHIAYEAIKNSVLKGDLIFVDEEGVPRGIPKL
jgi:hypothetical protein